MPDVVTAHASVATDAPERYAKQLASHLGRRCEVREEADGVRLVLPGGGSCLLAATDGALELRAEADSGETLDRITEVVGSHLVRFGQRNELVVDWQRA